MWSDNYKAYLMANIDVKNISDIETCDKDLQNLFKNLILGLVDFKSAKSTFTQTKNTALAELVERDKTDLETILTKASDIAIKKNNDYGSKNILKFGIIGIIVRIGDKISRYQNLVNNKTAQLVQDEKIEDTLLDIVNYATYGEMLSDGIWE